MAFENILLIDDDDEDQEIFLMAVKEISPGISCTCSSDAKEALRQLLSGEINPEMIFLDLNMPMMDGQQFLGYAKGNESLSSLPVVIFSTSSDPHTIRKVMESGAHEFITKPGSFDHLIELLKPLIN